HSGANYGARRAKQVCSCHQTVRLIAGLVFAEHCSVSQREPFLGLCLLLLLRSFWSLNIPVVHFRCFNTKQLTLSTSSLYKPEAVASEIALLANDPSPTVIR